MSLDTFFRDGNKLGILGSFVYLPEEARDLDITLFTHGGRNPFNCHPNYSDEIRDFLESCIGPISLRVDFSGDIWNNPSSPYDIDRLPIDSVSLDGQFLTGIFYPSIDFLVAHYKKLSGEDFLVQPWLRYMQHVEGFQNREVRLDKRPKDLPLILRATERLIEYGRKEFKPIVDEYRTKYQNLRNYYQQGRITIIEYENRAAQMIMEFLLKARNLVLDKAA